MRKFLVVIITTFFYLGYLPLVPGTFGSLAGIFLFYCIQGNTLAHLILIFILMLLGFLLSGEAERIFRQKDSRHIVIDEVTGMLLGLLFIPCDIKIIILAFFIFRLLDTLKPYPAGPLQKLDYGIGVMSDDLVAGIYTNLILHLILRFASFRTV
ncbi:phosphatidylglycerophosphatase A [bacterium]|nr:MAG: phosphatidylglycerophosphatase A [bacterium]